MYHYKAFLAAESYKKFLEVAAGKTTPVHYKYTVCYDHY